MSLLQNLAKVIFWLSHCGVFLVEVEYDVYYANWYRGTHGKGVIEGRKCFLCLKFCRQASIDLCFRGMLVRALMGGHGSR